MHLKSALSGAPRTRVLPTPFTPAPPRSLSPLTRVPPGGRSRCPGAFAAHGALCHSADPRRTKNEPCCCSISLSLSLSFLLELLPHLTCSLTGIIAALTRPRFPSFSCQDRRQEPPSPSSNRGGQFAAADEPRRPETYDSARGPTQPSAADSHPRRRRSPPAGSAPRRSSLPPSLLTVGRRQMPAGRRSSDQRPRFIPARFK